MRTLKYQRVQTAFPQSNLPAVAQHMFSLMLRNMSSDGFVFTDPYHLGVDFSTPGCIIASPSYQSQYYPTLRSSIKTTSTIGPRDAAVTAMELAAASLPARPGQGVQPLIDYVNFAQICQNNALIPLT